MFLEIEGYSEFSKEEIGYIAIFLGVLLLNIIIYRMFKKAYKKIPDKTVVAKLLKSNNYVKNSSAQYLEEQVSYTIAKYEYYINNRRHIIKFKCGDQYRIDMEKVLYYKIGSFDIRSSEIFELPLVLRVFWGLMLSIGTAGIALLINRAVFGVWYFA